MRPRAWVGHRGHGVTRGGAMAGETLAGFLHRPDVGRERRHLVVASLRGVPSIYSIVPPNDGSALRHGHHFEPVDFVIDHGRGHHDAYSAGSCQRTYARACGCRQRPRCHREELIESERGWSGREAFVTMIADRRPWARKRPFQTRPAERVVHPGCPCRATSGSLNRDNSRGMSQECAANAAR